MKNWMHLTMVAMMAVAAPACTAVGPGDGGDEGLEEGDVASDGVEEGDESAGEAEQGLDCQDNTIYHYTYTDNGGTYRWHVSYNHVTNRWYVDERRIGGGFYKQYNLTPGWLVCPFVGIQNITLKSGGTVLSGPHNCLPGLKEEVHLEKQRLLVRDADFVTTECMPL